VISVQNKLQGIITPIVTPMYDNEEVNYEELVNQVNRVIENGVHGIFTFGTNGEGYILSEEEKVHVMETVVDTVARRVPVRYNSLVSRSKACWCRLPINHYTIFCSSNSRRDL
jgi:dihydrodipicolinate synthase/N-acetylneuraminate lyase